MKRFTMSIFTIYYVYLPKWFLSVVHCHVIAHLLYCFWYVQPGMNTKPALYLLYAIYYYSYPYISDLQLVPYVFITQQ